MEAGSQRRDETPGDMLVCESTRDRTGNCGAEPKQDLAGIRIACFYPWTPFEPGGAWSRFQNYVEFLLDRGASVTLCVSGVGEETAIGRAAIRYLCVKPPYNEAFHQAGLLLRSGQLGELKKLGQEQLAFLLLFQSSFYTPIRPLAGITDEIVATHDLVSCEYPMMAGFLADLCEKHKKPLIVTGHDVMSAAFATHPFAVAQIHAAEVAAYRRASAVFFCVDADRRFFAEHGIEGRTVLTTGRVPLRHERKGDSLKRELEAIQGAELRPNGFVLFVGSPHGPNAEAALEMKKLAKLLPRHQCVVAGACVPSGRDGNFVALGQVSDQVLETLYAGSVAVAIPLRRGTGISVKTFQAFSMAKAVVSTAVGVRGFALEKGRHYLEADTIEQFATQIRLLTGDQATRKNLENEAYRFAQALDCRSLFDAYLTSILDLASGAASADRPKPAKLWLVDNTLSNQAGHHFNYALSISKACSETGTECRVLANKALGEALHTELGAKGVFGSTIHERALSPFPEKWGQITDQYNLMHGSVVFARELEQALRDGVAAGDCVFLPNANPEQILAVAALIERHAVYRYVEFVLLLRYTLSSSIGPLAQRKVIPDAKAVWRHRLAIERLCEVRNATKVRWATDSMQLAQEYDELFGIRCEVLPIPHTHPTSDIPSELVPPKVAGRKRVVFLGDAREEKGFELLTSLVRTWPKSGPLAEVEFIFQAVITSGFHAPMYEHIETMRKLAHPLFRLVPKVLGASEYNSLLRSADVVLLPYDAGTYKGRTSGPFMEAICLGKPVVAPKGTWMQHQLGNSEAGVLFQSGNPSEFCRAVVSVIQRYDAHATAARELGAALSQANNPVAMVRTLMGIEPTSESPMSHSSLPFLSRAPANNANSGTPFAERKEPARVATVG